MAYIVMAIQDSRKRATHTCMLAHAVGRDRPLLPLHTRVHVPRVHDHASVGTWLTPCCEFLGRVSAKKHPWLVIYSQKNVSQYKSDGVII